MHASFGGFNDLRSLFEQYDQRKIGVVPRTTFVEVFRQFSVVVPEPILFFLCHQFLSPFEQGVVSYTRFLNFISPESGLTNPINR